MSHEVELISDGDGLAVVGEPSAVERFMTSVGLSTENGPSRATALNFGAVAAAAGAAVAQSGRWVKLTEDSARAVKQFGLMDTGVPGVKHAMVGQPGEIRKWVQIVKGPGAMATNPAVLAGGAGIMAQMAMQQTMAEITDYLAVIDEKLDDVLRAQTNQVLARMDGVEIAISEAMSIRESVGRVSEVTWSKVQGSAQTINETQGYALRQLADLADKIEGKKSIAELSQVVEEAATEVQKWLYVLARCFELHDAVAVLELDRVLDATPDELDRHRVGLKAARSGRLELIAGKTAQLLVRMTEAADTANARVLLNPMQSPAVVRSSNHVTAEVHELRVLLGIESDGGSFAARPWKDAASERWGKVRDGVSGGVDAGTQRGSETLEHAKAAGTNVRDKGAEGVDTVKRLGGETRDRARSIKDRLADRKVRTDEDDEDADK